jgi:perosamine synthetase
MEYARKNGVLLGDWYDIPVAPRGVDLIQTGYKNGSCPNAEEVCGKIVNLPLNVNMTKKDIQKVVAVIRGYYR